jgi:hypothetical protein
MLPTSTTTRRTPPARGKHSSLAWLYARRLFKPKQMDFQMAFWTMAQLVVSPKTAYRQTSYHKQTKNFWARDDPAFVVLTAAMVAATALAYGLFFKGGLIKSLSICLSAVAFDYLAIGAIVATAGWFVSNHRLRRRGASHPHPHAVDQTVEWGYCFDVHCNAFFPTFLLLYVAQLALSPVLLLGSRVAAALSAALYAAGVAEYWYLTFLGYSALPFLDGTEVFLYPIGLAAVLLPVALVFGFNPTQVKERSRLL